MRLAIILNTNHPETAWNALRFGNQAVAEGHEPSVFLMGSGVEIANIRDDQFDVAAVLQKYLDGGGSLLACRTCLEMRHQEAGICPISTMSQLVEVIANSDKAVTFG